MKDFLWTFRTDTFCGKIMLKSGNKIHGNASAWCRILSLFNCLRSHCHKFIMNQPSFLMPVTAVSIQIISITAIDIFDHQSTNSTSAIDFWRITSRELIPHLSDMASHTSCLSALPIHLRSENWVKFFRETPWSRSVASLAWGNCLTSIIIYSMLGSFK